MSHVKNTMRLNFLFVLNHMFVVLALKLVRMKVLKVTDFVVTQRELK